MSAFLFFFFFFQAEDGIRDYKVTGVQTCALPISGDVAGAVSTVPQAGRGAAAGILEFRPGARDLSQTGARHGLGAAGRNAPRVGHPILLHAGPPARDDPGVTMPGNAAASLSRGGNACVGSAWSGSDGRARRLLNVVVAAVGLVLALPLMLVLAALIKVTSRGPVLFRQTRIGLDRRALSHAGGNTRRHLDLGGQPFTLHKFRTMRADARDPAPQAWAAPNDERATGIGGLLRRRPR